ncbi:NrdH-redoxin [Variovorax sp. WS11]|uniref:glutaredoxin family protein n=1 Tax=Variovorax sp. WS11 TaxID=1105204 RepID=UPI000D0D354F|nr:glutaredoxin family protein [Variovorax sp. WS11]NDZ11954.1 glutaredoxin family protein [Variovorax sp. WS11]PSL82712.1 NrdH-redoxin [Variovorax sp. WS11]
MKIHSRFSAPALLLLLAAGAAFAQPVYRHVDKNGKVTFSDQPPAADAQAAAPRGGAAGGSGPALPYELRQVAQRYPVTIYTGDECGPCGAGRSLLVTRGIPFEERTVKSNEDIEALQRLSGGQPSLPLLSIGSQQLKGFSDAEWSQYLDAAGYPKSAQLPAGYRNPPAQPLVAIQAAPARPVAAPAPAPVPAPAAANGPTPSNPAGIKF